MGHSGPRRKSLVFCCPALASHSPQAPPASSVERSQSSAPVREPCSLTARCPHPRHRRLQPDASRPETDLRGPKILAPTARSGHAPSSKAGFWNAVAGGRLCCAPTQARYPGMPGQAGVARRGPPEAGSIGLPTDVRKELEGAPADSLSRRGCALDDGRRPVEQTLHGRIQLRRQRGGNQADHKHADNERD